MKIGAEPTALPRAHGRIHRTRNLNTGAVETVHLIFFREVTVIPERSRRDQKNIFFDREENFDSRSRYRANKFASIRGKNRDRA